ncbi:MAG: hypothetical protein K2N53_03695 [Clostridia bacterium]|nr:hypothetical protein [Clostridia bacterium]
MASKFPIILVYGIFVKEMKYFKAFGKIEKVLKNAGYDVYTARTDSFGTVENNALQLKEQIEILLQKRRAEKVNVIAYSKGGLDARYLIEKLDMEKCVASLTTISAPHKGTRLATRFYSYPKCLLKPFTFCLNGLYKILGDKKPNSLEVLRSLQEIPDEEYSNEVVCKSVYSQSYSLRMDKYGDDILLGIPFALMKKIDGSKCDGAVTHESSKWGEYKGHCTDTPMSHRQIIDFLVGKKKKQKIYEFYLSLCQDLADRGF